MSVLDAGFGEAVLNVARLATSAATSVENKRKEDVKAGK